MFRIKDILEATGGVLISGYDNVIIQGISTDSRTIKAGDIFIPLKGTNYDGHDFIWQALKDGAVAALTQEKCLFDTDKPIIKVNDTLKALQDIAAYHRNRFDIDVVGITGSTGKTTTKEMIAAVLSTRYNTLKTQGNYNNYIGLPLTLLSLNKSHDIAVIEMGMSAFGEIRMLKNIAKPNIAVYTNIGISHIEKLGSRENILKAKLEMIEDFEENNVVVLNADDDMLSSVIKDLKCKVMTYGIKAGDIRAYDIKQADKLHFKVDLGKPMEFVIDAHGIHNVYNALAAIAVGMIFKLNPELIAKGLKNFHPEKMRLNIIKGNRFTIIDDAYNASPDSMKSAINVLKEVTTGRSIAILGDMKELGDYSNEAHYNVGEYVGEKKVDVLICVGDFAREIAHGAKAKGMDDNNIYCKNDNISVKKLLSNLLKEHDTILVKGSRAMKMEEIVEYLRREEVCQD